MLQRDNDKTNRGINTENGRSVIFDDTTGRRYELIPRATLDELFEIRIKLPWVEIKNIAKNTRKVGESRADKRYYKIRIGDGGHSIVGLAREIKSDDSYGDYIVVKKVKSDQELLETYSRSNSERLKQSSESRDNSQHSMSTDSSLSASSSSSTSSSSGSMNSGPTKRRARTFNILSNSSQLPTTSDILPDEKDSSWKANSRSASTSKFFRDSKRQQIIDSIERELSVNRILADFNTVSLPESRVLSVKKKKNETQLYLFTPYAMLGDIQHLQKRIIDFSYFNFAEVVKFKTNITNQMIRCVALLHDESLVRHRDIKLDNFLLTHEGKVLLTDFGASAYLDKNEMKPTWKLVSPTTFIDNTPPKLISRDSLDDTFKLHDEWALAKAILDLWQIDTTELGVIRKWERNENLPVDEITKHYADYLEKIRNGTNSMQVRGMPVYLQDFIFAALEIDPNKRKSNINEMFDINNLQGPEISNELAKIKSAIDRHNNEFFHDASPSDKKYLIEGAQLGHNTVIGYVHDDQMTVDHPAKTSRKF